MCGIMAVIVQQHKNSNIKGMLLDGLKELENRGDDSVGISVLSNDMQIETFKFLGGVDVLKAQTENYKINSNIAIGHLRWASQGKVTIANAHPHTTQRVAIVHNGDITNYMTLKKSVLKNNPNFIFKSDTDSEVIAALYDQYLQDGNTPEEAVANTVERLEGTFAIVFLSQEHPDSLFAAVSGSSLVLCVSDNATFLASTPHAFKYSNAQKYIRIRDECHVKVEATSYQIYTRDHEMIKPNLDEIYDFSHELFTQSSDISVYKTHMWKEINEQPTIMRNMLQKYTEDNVDERLVSPFAMLNKIATEIEWSSIQHVHILGCGSSKHVGLIGRKWISSQTEIFTSAETASEYDPNNQPRLTKVAIVISQSGETADTLQVMREIKKAPETIAIIAIVNDMDSKIANEAHYALPMLAGTEISVAATKSVITSLLVVAMLSLKIAQTKGIMSSDKYTDIMDNVLSEIPGKIQEIIDADNHINDIVKSTQIYQNMQFVGTQSLLPVAYEGALKIKEIVQEPAEGEVAGEIKHGPLALSANQKNLVVVLIPPSSDAQAFKQTISAINVLAARDAPMLCVNNKGDQDIIKSQIHNHEIKWSIDIPDADNFLCPIEQMVVMHILAYDKAKLLERNIDHPPYIIKANTTGIGGEYYTNNKHDVVDPIHAINDLYEESQLLGIGEEF